MNHATLALLALLAVLLAGCKEDVEIARAPQPAATPATAPAAADDHEHAEEAVLGTKPAGEYQVKAVQTGAYTDGEFDADITGGPGGPNAVRFWIGTESAEGSAKAKASSNNGTRWHGHPRAPKTLPAGAQFWVEVEPPTGPAARVAFDLKK